MLRVSDPDSSPAELVFSSLGNTEAGHFEHQDYPGRFVLWLVRYYSASQIFLQVIRKIYWRNGYYIIIIFLYKNMERKKERKTEKEKGFDRF